MSSQFSSHELSAINDEADSVISAHLACLDRVSNDIKRLEDILKKSAIPFTFIYILYSELKFLEHKTPYCEVPTELYAYDDHCLVWTQTSKGTRLSYNAYRTKAEYNSDNKKKIGDEVYLKSSNPLIESKALFRLKIEKELPFFYKGIIEKLKIYKKEDWYFLYSPSYEDNSNLDYFDFTGIDHSHDFAMNCRWKESLPAEEKSSGTFL